LVKPSEKTKNNPEDREFAPDINKGKDAVG
jgi:hypothetical protein